MVMACIQAIKQPTAMARAMASLASVYARMRWTAIKRLHCTCYIIACSELLIV